MSWLNVWDNLKNKTCRYLLQRYLGRFLDDKLRLEQLKIELYNGRATLHDVTLNMDTLNELFEEQGWAVQVTGGQIGELTVNVPWNALMTNNSSIEVCDLVLCLRPIQREHSNTSMLESMWSSVSSSRQLAEECIKQDLESADKAANVQNQAIDGLEKFAETIDNVLNRITAKFTNTTIILEHQLSDQPRGIRFKFCVKDFFYKNESGCETRTTKNCDESHMESSIHANAEHEKWHLTSTYAKHNIHLNGILVSSEEFSTFDKNREMENTSIAILKINGQQKAVIKIKQSEEINGPKILLDMELGSIYSLVTPRQVHLALRFWSAFSEGDNGTHSKRNTTSELLHGKGEYGNTKKVGMTGMLTESTTWGEATTTALLLKDLSTNCDNVIRPQRTFCDSMYSSISSNSTVTTATRFQRKLANIESSAEIVKFNVRVACCTINVLHEDILFESSINSGALNESSVSSAQELSHDYFDALTDNDEENTASQFKVLQEKNYINLRITPILLDGIQQRNKDVLLFKLSASAAKLDLNEMLKGTKISLLIFDRTENCALGYQKRPDFALAMKSTSCNMENLSNTVLDITLEKSTLDFDISIYDRVSALMGPSPFVDCATPIPDKVEDAKQPTPSTQLNISCNLFDINLRFPIVDARPIHDPDRILWWKRNIRDDFLQVMMQQLRCAISLSSFKIFANEIDVFYHESSETQIHFLKATSTTKQHHNTLRTEIENPQINIQFDTGKMFGSSNTKTNTIPTPFCAERVCRQSDTIHKKRDFADTETIILPGNREELKAFRDSSVENSNLHVQIILPNVTMMVQSKQLYEIIYNRLNYNLFLWEPSSPLLKKCDFDDPLGANDVFNMEFSMQNLNIGQRLDESDDDTCDNRTPRTDADMYKSVYFSTHENNRSQCPKDLVKLKNSTCSVELLIPSGVLTCFVPVRDADNHVLPEHSGRLDFQVKGFQFFCVSGYRGNSNKDYIFLQSRVLEMFHCGIVPEDCPKDLFDLQSQTPHYMNCTIYEVPRRLTKRNTQKNPKRDMVSLVIETNKMPAQRIKRIRLTAGLQTAALRYHPEVPSHTWLNQIIDFLDVQDDIVNGYQPYGVLTEMQLHLWDLAIDYRPKTFPFRTILEIESFSISSNVISALNGCNLRFISEECVLQIGPNTNNVAQHPPNTITALPPDNLVPILDVGLLDISLRLSDKVSEINPKFDLRCSLHDGNLRTCFDSGKALAQLIAYFASDGDFENKMESSSMTESSFSTDSILSYKPAQTSQEITEEQQERVSSMMAEAVQETIRTSAGKQQTSNSSTSQSRGIERFYFPDEGSKLASGNPSNEEAEINNELSDILNFESNVMSSTYTPKPDMEDATRQVKEDLGVIESTANTSSASDEDFLIVSEDEHMFKDGGAVNLPISNEPLRIVDNHFHLPMDKPDLLRPPENFPMAELRYTICEMTFTWHMYGGKDFPDDASASEKKKFKGTGPAMSEAYRYGVAYTKSANNVKFAKEAKEKLSWRTIGGPGRDHQELVEFYFSKVRFSHEVYPLHTPQASRQVLLINEIEIRDRLKSSEINKFLYHPNQKNLSNKSPQQMLVVKALHVRSESENDSSQECSLRISLLPLRLNIDQNTLIFLVEYFSNLGDTSTVAAEKSEDTRALSKPAPNPKLSEPIMTVEDVPQAVHDLHARKVVSTNLDLLMNTTMEQSTDTSKNSSSSSEKSIPQTTPIYFREVVFSPEVSIRLDYHGHKIELSRGPIAGLLMGLGQLQCSEIRLRNLVYRRGILGVEKLLTYLCKEWLKDIKRNQLQNILSGVGPTYAIVQLFQGIYDLFWMPIEQYQKDGRLIRGLQLGAQSFTARTALAALEITSRVIQLLQLTAETAFDMVSPGPSVRRHIGRKGKKRRPNRPKDIREGLGNAYFILKEGINDSATTLIETAAIEHDQKGYTGAVGAVMRQIPQLMMCPAVLATQATTNILGGVKNALVPEAQIEAREKWKRDTD